MAEATSDLDSQNMDRAFELARRGQGLVEPNPMVGCVIVNSGEVVGEGWHQHFGGPHAEINALQSAGPRARGADAFVSLEPCCHQGKTGPCTRALIDAGVSRVVIGCNDPNPQVAGRGVAELQKAGITVLHSTVSDKAVELIAPFAKLVTTGRPWVIAKWAMTLDGKIATRTGSSQWISGERSRAKVHELRGRVDGIIVGRGTAVADDPLLIARPSGPRVATRIVLDSEASLSCRSQLVETVGRAPLLVAVGEKSSPVRRQELQARGAEVFVCPGENRIQRLMGLLDELGRRQMTNVLVEGGAEVLGTFFDTGTIDEVRVFIAPKLIGGREGLSPLAGKGLAEMAHALSLRTKQIEVLDEELMYLGIVNRSK